MAREDNVDGDYPVVFIQTSSTGRKYITMGAARTKAEAEEMATYYVQHTERSEAYVVHSFTYFNSNEFRS